MRLASMNHPGGMVMTRMLGLILLALGIAVLIGGGLLAWHSYQEHLEIRRAGQEAELRAEALAEQVREIRNALSSEEVLAVVGDGQWQGDDLRAVLRRQQVANVLNLAAATGAIEQVDLSAFPGSGFAVLEMMLRTRSGATVPAQVHFAGTPDEYFAVVEPVAVAGQAPIVLVATFPVSVLVNRLRQSSLPMAMRLHQESGANQQTVAEVGGLFTSAAGSMSIPGTSLRLEWSRSGALDPLSMAQLAGLLGVGLLALLLAFFLLRRTGQPALQQQGSDSGRRRKEPVLSLPGSDRTELLKDQELAAQERSAAQDSSRSDSKSATYDEAEPGSRDPSASGSGETFFSTLDRDPDFPEIGKPRDEVSGDRDQDSTAADRSSEEQKGDSSTSESLRLVSDTGPDSDEQSEEDIEINQMLAELVAEGDQSEARDEADDEVAAEPGADQGYGTKQDPDPDPKPQPAAVENLPPASIFRAYDIRGVVGDTLSPEIAEAIGRAIGSEARDEELTRIAVARDGRLSGAEMLTALIRGLTACGMEVIEVGAVPTPVLYYAAQELAGGSGVMVTGSHNPPDYNGFKIVLGGETLSGERIQALYQRLQTGNLVDGKGEVSQQQIAARYLERIGTDVQLEKPLKVVVDCGNGIAGSIAPQLLEAIGAEVIPLYAEVDGTFPNHHPDPGDPATLEDLKLCVRNFNAEVGVAFDGDGDRLGVVAPDGEIIYPDRIMMLFARDVLSRNLGQPIIFDVKCSSLLAGEIEKAGGKPIMGRTGHSFIKKQLKLENAPFAGEMSGHFFFAERWYGFDDGMYAAARLLEILAADTRASGQILAELPKAVSTPELKVEMKEGEPHPFVQSFVDSVELEGAKINTVDGFRADFEDGFGLVRASNTTPVLVCRFEGNDARALHRIQDQFRKAMLKINPALKLPF